jgi:hypothetical protein
MGTFRKPLLTDSIICRLYADGMSRAEIGWRAKIYDHEILIILRRNGIAIRNSVEGQVISRARRERLRARLAP